MTSKAKSMNLKQISQNYLTTTFTLRRKKKKKSTNPYYHPLDDDEEAPPPTYTELLIQMLENYHPKSIFNNSKIKNTSKISYTTHNNSSMNQFNGSRTATCPNTSQNKNAEFPNFNSSKKHTIENYKTSYHSKKLRNTKSMEMSKLSMSQRAKNKLSKVYKYENYFMKNKERVINSKDVDLEQYQENLLKLSGNTFCKDNMVRLYTELKNLRNNTETIKPLPPINFPALIRYTVEKNKINLINSSHRRGGKNKINNIKEKMRSKYNTWSSDNDVDEYEKELQLIKKSNKSGKYYKYVNPNYQKYEMQKYALLPEYLVESLMKRKKEI